MARRTTLDFGRPGLFTPTKVRRTLDDSGAVFKKNFEDLSQTNVESTSSFRYDPPFLGIRSTQQIPTDFSKFENHTFFNSAEVNVNVAFDRIINQYPFDGSRKEVESFLDSLTGFEKWIFDNFPVNKGYLNFSGSSNSSFEGTYIVVNDFVGSTYPSVSRVVSGESILDPGKSPFTIELHIFIPEQPNDNQIICQKISGSAQGITLALSQSNSPQSCSIVFGVVSGSRDVKVSADILKGQFAHVVASFDRRVSSNKAIISINENVVAESDTVQMGLIDFKFSPLTIASGTTHDRLFGSKFIPYETFSGSIDELRIFHDARPIKQQKLFAQKSIFQTPELKLYYKFNEPSGSFGPNDVILDSSGNSLHSKISNFSFSLRNTSSMPSPLIFEKAAQNPVLFPAYKDVQLLNSRLLASASVYDENNPNLITKLVPNHYFVEGQTFESLENEVGTIGETIGGSGIPGSAELGSSQLISSFLYVWAKFFDEVKMMIDLFGSSLFVDYDKPGYIADQFLPFLAKYYGFEMPAFFINSSIEQFVDAENIQAGVSTSQGSLRYVQNQLWRRILTNIGEVVRSKGTLHSIKSLFRSMGIEPDSNFRIREFGGPTSRPLENSRETRSDITTFLNFSGSITGGSPLIISPFLSSSRVEPGYPEIKGNFAKVNEFPPHGISDEPSDGLFTSGSWTYEAMYRWPTLLSGSHLISQSLARMYVTGTSANPAGLIFNLVAVSGSNVKLFASTASGTVAPFEIELTGTNIMDGRLWNVSFGRYRNDEINSHKSSSYFLRAARSEFGQIIVNSVTSSFYKPGDASVDVLQNISTATNAHGAFFAIGSQSIEQTVGQFINDPSNNSFARWTQFSGRVGQIRFWSKGLEENEWLEHVRNPRSVGVLNPLTNFNFVKTSSGSFEKIRIDASIEQQTSMSSNSGDFEVFDFSQNNFHLAGSGFEPEKIVLAPERIFFSQLSPRFDEASSNNKVRVRGFQSFKNVQLYGGEISPVYEVPRYEMPNDDVRFSIDFSIMDALNEDIVRIFSTLDTFDNVLGNPELIFSPDYPGLEDLRDVYFNRLTDKIRLRQFFEFFKWFDSILGISQLVEQLVPKKTKFLGTNFVIESHMLERPKFEYIFNDIYLGENDRHGLKGTILLQQFSALLKRY